MMCRKKETQARIVDGGLVVWLPDAASPAVWRADLARLHNASVSVKQKKEGYAVLVRTTEGVEEIAVFADESRATKALQAVTAAMLCGMHAGRGHCWLRRLLYLAFLVFFLLILSQLLEGRPGRIRDEAQGGVQQMRQLQQGLQKQAQPAPETGVPLSGEDFLKNLPPAPSAPQQ